MPHKSFIFALFVYILQALLPVLVMAQENEGSAVKQDDNMVVKVVDGHKFRVPEDMPIEKKDGIIAPMEISEYISRKFAKLEKRVEGMEISMKEIEDRLNSLQGDAGLVAEGDGS